MNDIKTKDSRGSSRLIAKVRMRFDRETSRYEMLNAADAPDLLEAM